MATFLLLYLVISIERVASFLSVFMFLGFCLAVAWFIVLIATACASEHKPEGTFTTIWAAKKPWRKRIVTWMFVFIFFGATAKLLPTQQEMLMIAGGTATYHVITSEAGVEVGKSAYGALLRKLDSIAAEPEETVEEVVK